MSSIISNYATRASEAVAEMKEQAVKDLLTKHGLQELSVDQLREAGYDVMFEEHSDPEKPLTGTIKASLYKRIGEQVIIKTDFQKWKFTVTTKKDKK